MVGDKKRKMSANWIMGHHWIRYSVSKDSVYCAYCVMFGKESKEKNFIHPFSDWKNLGAAVKRHEDTKTGLQHIGCVSAAENYLQIKDNKKKSVVSLLSSSHHDQVIKNRHILKKIIEVIILCGKQNIPIRGHTEQTSNFMAILKDKALCDQVLSEHLQFRDPRKQYTSPEIQNELIEICGKQVRAKIVNECNQAPCFAIIADECTDKATKEQLSLCVRFVDQKTTEAREEFVGFAHAQSIRGGDLTDLIVSTLEDVGLDINRVRAQCYDGASNMAGKYNGVQARIKQLVPGANYVHCKAHCLNLALVHSSKEPCVRTMMATVQEVAFAFDYSAKRLTAFSDELAADNETREQLEQRTKLRTLCETRWSSRADALYTFKSAFPVVVHSLETLQDDGDVKAGQHLASILRFEFLVALVTAEHILSATVNLSSFLQAINCDMIEAITETRVVSEWLTNERNDPLVWDALYQQAVDLADQFGIMPCVPRRAGRQQHRANYDVNVPADYWKVALFYVFTDHLIQEMNQRLLQNEDRFLAQYLVPAKQVHLDDQMIDRIFDAYQDIPVSRDLFRLEINRWKAKWNVSTDKPDKVADTLKKTNKDLYPGTHIVLTVLLTMPPSSATAERSFSVMRRIKNFLRSTMGDARLSSLAVLHAHRDVDISIDKIIDEFAATKNRKLDFV